jgi:hypothetical protein
MQTGYIQLRKTGEKSSNRRFPVTLANKARPAFAHETKAGEQSGIDDFSPKGNNPGESTSFPPSQDTHSSDDAHPDDGWGSSDAYPCMEYRRNRHPKGMPPD